MNKAFWIKLVKDIGANGGMANLKAESHRQYAETKEAIDHLVMAGYVKMNGKPGATYRKWYEVTTLGHRYLNEHQDELATWQPTKKRQPVTTTGAADNLHHAVPETPQFQESPVRPPVISRPPQTVTTRLAIDGRSRRSELGAGSGRFAVHISPAPPAAAPAPAPAPIITPQTAALATAMPRNAHDQVRAALADILIERFADQVTAKELLERLDTHA